MSANAGEALKSMSKVASGGELARIMLAMKNVLAEKDQVQTLIFDEVDTGVSGRAAQRVAEKLRAVADFLVENESMISRQLKKASGFTLSRKKKTFNPTDPTTPIENPKNGMAFDSLIAGLEMGTHVCIADFEYLISKKGEPYGWGLARYCTPEAMYPDLFPIKEAVEGRTPKQSRKRILDHLCQVLPDIEKSRIEKILD
jgi:hypothetical protein